MPEYPRSPFDKNGKSITPKVADDVLDATIIGSTTPAAGAFTTLESETIKAINQTNAIENTSKLLQTEDIFSDFVVTGLLPATSANLISDISAGHAYVTGTRVNKAVTSKTYTASVDTYVDVNSVGTYTFPEVALGAAAPAVTADSIRLTKVVTDGTAITGVTDLRELQGIFVSRNVKINGLLSQDGLGGSTYFGFEAGKVDDLSANNNVGIGYQALSANTSGYQNTALGLDTLKTNTTGYHNTAIGLDTLGYNTTGYRNTAVGVQALYNNTTGHSNIAVGMQALLANTTGYQNTALGLDTLKTNTTGYHNTAIGYATLLTNSTGLRNIALGYQAGRYELDSDKLYINNQDRATTADDKAKSIIYGIMAAAVADQRLTFNADVTIAGTINAIDQTNAIENTSKLLQTEDIFSDFVVTGLLPATSADLISDISLGHAYVTGTRVNKAATSKTYTASVDTYVDVNSAGTYTFPEVALGAAAPAITADSIRLAKVVTNATAITGVTDLRELQGIFVSRNVKINGLLSQTGLGGSTYLGFEAGKVDDLTNNYNTGIGHQAIKANTTGAYNTALGMQALLANSTGYSNVAVGVQALYANSTGYNNTAVGQSALYDNSTGLGNIALGYYAGRYELGNDAFYVNNQNRTNTAGDKLKSIIYGIMAAAVADQRLVFNADVEIAGIVKTPKTQTLTGAGAVDIVSAITHLVTAGVGDALTLADGAEGQVKTILTKTETTAGDTSVLTPTSFAHGTNMTFDAPGDIVTLLFTNGTWYYTGGRGVILG